MDIDIIFPKPQQIGKGRIKVACIGDGITYGMGVMDDRSKSYPALLLKCLVKIILLKISVSVIVRQFQNIRMDISIAK